MNDTRITHFKARKLAFVSLSHWVTGFEFSQTSLGEELLLAKDNFVEKDTAVNTEWPIFIAVGGWEYQPVKKKKDLSRHQQLLLQELTLKCSTSEFLYVEHELK